LAVNKVSLLHSYSMCLRYRETDPSDPSLIDQLPVDFLIFSAKPVISIHHSVSIEPREIRLQLQQLGSLRISRDLPRPILFHPKIRKVPSLAARIARLREIRCSPPRFIVARHATDLGASPRLISTFCHPLWRIPVRPVGKRLRAGPRAECVQLSLPVFEVHASYTCQSR